MFIEELLDFCCEMGRQLTRNGGEIYRVEESITRILAAYGYPQAEVFAIPSYVTVSVREAGHTYTSMVRIRDSANRLEYLDRLNDLCRRICREPMEIGQARAELEAIVHRALYPVTVSYLLNGVVAAFSTLLWGGTAPDACIAFFCGLLIRLIVPKLRSMRTNIFFLNVIAAMAQAAVPLLLIRLGLPNHSDKVIIGTIMLLVPGLAITNAMRDVLAGDFLTFVVRMAEVLITAVAIALGIAVSIALFRLIPTAKPLYTPTETRNLPALQCVYAAIACLGFCGVFEVHRLKFVLASCFAGGAAWGIYLLTANCSQMVRYLIATIACALLAEIFARIFRAPATLFLLVGIIPMVPGGGLYYTMEALLNGDRVLCAELGIQTAAAATAIAVGVSLVSSLMRLIPRCGVHHIIQNKPD